MTHPRSTLLQSSLDRLAEVRWGLQAYLDRVDEWADGGYPGSGTGSGSSGTSDPTGGQVGDDGERWGDTAKDELRAFDRLVDRVHEDVRKLHTRWVRGVEPQDPPDRMEDPGCELCAEVTVARPLGECDTRACRPSVACAAHGGYPAWSRTYVTSEIEVRDGRNRTRSVKRRMCEWCWRFSRPIERGGRGRLPSKEERHAHVRGERVRVKAS